MVARRVYRKPAGTRRKARAFPKKRTMNIAVPRRIRTVPQISVKRTCYLGSMSPNTTATYGFWQYRTVSLTNAFYDGALSSMGGLSNLSEYTAIFDQFKLSAFKIVLRPRVVDINMDQAVNTLGRDLSYVTIIKDPTDNTSPTGAYTQATLNSFLETGNARTYRGDKPVTIYMKPKVQEQYGSGANRYVSPQWTDLTTAGTTMPHRGFHLFFHNQGMSGNFASQVYDVFVTYYLQFRGMK